MAILTLTRRVTLLPSSLHRLPSILTRNNVIPSFTHIPRKFDHSLATQKKESHVTESDTSSEPPENSQPAFSTLRMQVSSDTLRAITDKPFNHVHMSPVQAAVLPLLPELARPYDGDHTQGPPRDLLVKAKTGTGKTLAFLVPAIEARIKAIDKAGVDALEQNGGRPDARVVENAKRAYARKTVGTVIISPTRELATQIAQEAIKLTHWQKDFEVKLFAGGSSRGQQLRDFRYGRNDIVVATPGRIRDFLENDPDVAEKLKTTSHLVLDEADTLLDMGFRPDIDAIADFFPKTPIRQTFLFSATVSPAIRQVAREVLDKDHAFIDVASNDSSPVHAHIPQHYTVLPSAKEQLPHLIRSIAHDQLANPGNSKIIVFLNTTKQTQLFASLLSELSKTLPATRTRIYEIHSKRNQNARSNASQAFRNDRSGASILVTSDVSARGIDYPGVTRVIQVGSPKSTEQYVHRIGRTGRAGKGGRADLHLLPFEQNFVRYQLSDMPIKELSHDNLLTETASLAEKFETDPTAYWSSVEAAKPRASESNTRNRLISNKPGTALAKLDSEVPALFEQIDEEAIREVFVSLVGFYMPQAENMRVTRRSIYEGVQTWTTEACGLPKAPFISDSLLAKMGGLDGRSSSFGAQRGPLRKSFGSKRPATRYMNIEQNRQRNDWPDREGTRAPRYGQDEKTGFGSKWMGRGSRSSRDGERRSGERRDGEWRKSSRPNRSEWSRD